MKITSCITQTINDYQLEIDEKEYYYKEFLDYSGKVIDDGLFDIYGLVVEDEDLLQRVREHIDEKTGYYS